MMLKKRQVPGGQDLVFDVSGTDPALGRGCYTVELMKAMTVLGFKTGPVFRRFGEGQLGAELEAEWSSLHADLKRGIPSIVCMHYDQSPMASEHFRLILGYEAKTDEVVYHDPALKQGAYLRMNRSAFLAMWPLKSAVGSGCLIRLRADAVKPGLPASYVRPHFPPSAYAQHVLRLRGRIPKSFTVQVEEPFVVIGDGSPGGLPKRAAGTVRWAVAKLKHRYYSKDPETILDVWLFQGKKSYEQNTKRFIGEAPDSPYGFFSSEKGALVMNIQTGGGTLVHEIVHPYMQANFPGCPPWFNEGMGSLYEASTEREGEIVGLVNWRLKGLQEAIRKGPLPSFEYLMKLDDTGFYEQDRGTNYAQARYLCYYLQEKALLVNYYRQFTAHAKDDPSGFQTLKLVMGESDMTAFQQRWQDFVMSLKAP
jgi:hypothetical protein